MFCWIYIALLFTTVQTLVLVEAQISTETCVEDKDTQKSVKLDCMDGYISDVNVISGTGHCLHKQGRCLGMTPSVLVDHMNCYWRHECLISWPRDPIIYTEPYEVDRTCIGRKPNFMRIRYKCFNPTDHQEEYGQAKMSGNDIHSKRLLIDVCSNLKGGTSVYDRTGNSSMHLAGIIRSHKLYPWDYSNKPRNCTVNIYWPKGQTTIVVTVQNIDLSEDDSLTIGNKRGESVKVTSAKTSNFSYGDVTSFVFNVGVESNSGKGFLLCFKFVSNLDEAKVDACESIMTVGKVTNVKPVTDSLGPLLVNQDTTTTAAITTQPTPKSATLEIPKRCLKKNTEKKRLRCAKKHWARKNRPKKNKKPRKRNRRKDKRNRRRRRHGVRRNK